ncbi:hypothetical protein RHMOL_Rhmol11G0076100 [Rhododendron molle]|uniref:Uncharacterized protein n=1 Tax=Rhododendron molle TaxID=49168 RepID=A0ACC0LPK9_RHOML|nr:hypothetical protein RHMOL_Rhmol11G0076100 [Rhododendron molle]
MFERGGRRRRQCNLLELRAGVFDRGFEHKVVFVSSRRARIWVARRQRSSEVVAIAGQRRRSGGEVRFCKARGRGYLDSRFEHRSRSASSRRARIWVARRQRSSEVVAIAGQRRQSGGEVRFCKARGRGYSDSRFEHRSRSAFSRRSRGWSKSRPRRSHAPVNTDKVPPLTGACGLLRRAPATFRPPPKLSRRDEHNPVLKTSVQPLLI